jgi:hypothetical protein
LDISVICLFGVIRVLFHVVCSLHSHWHCEARVKRSRDTTKVNVQTLLGVIFEHACSTEEAFFLVKSQTFGLVITLLKCRIIRISELSDIGLKEFYCILYIYIYIYIFTAWHLLRYEKWEQERDLTSKLQYFAFHRPLIFH